MMYEDRWHDGAWGWMVFMGVAWVVVIAALAIGVWALIRLAQNSDRLAGPREQRRETPQEILDRRLASGEIDADEYARARDALAGRGS